MSGPHLSSLALDELVHEALPAGETAAARAHLDGCPACRAELATATELRAHFDGDVYARTLPRVRPSRARWAWLGLSALTAAALLLLWIGRRERVTELGIGIKGTAAWQVFANRNGETFAVHDGSALAANDRIRFVVTASDARYVLVASVDGAGRATVYYPYGGDHSARLPSARVELPGSIALDDSAGPERLFAVLTDEPIEAAAVTSQLRAIGARGAAAIRSTTALDVPARAQLSLVFEKVAP